MLGLRLTNMGLGMTDLDNQGGDDVANPGGDDVRNQILMTVTYTTHSANAFPLLLPPPSF